MPRPRQLRRESTLDEMEVQRWAQHNSQRRVAPEHFKDGSLIQRLAEEHCELFGQLFHEKRAVFPPRELLLGSACTGSASEVVAAHYFQRAANAVSDSGFRIRPVFTCEIKKEKRKWIAGVHEAFPDACAPSANASASGQGLASGHSVTSGQASSGAACIFHDIADVNIQSAEEEDADRRLASSCSGPGDPTRPRIFAFAAFSGLRSPADTRPVGSDHQ